MSLADANCLLEWTLLLLKPPVQSLSHLLSLCLNPDYPLSIPRSHFSLSEFLYHFTLREPDKIRHVWKHLVTPQRHTLQSCACSHYKIICPGHWDGHVRFRITVKIIWCDLGSEHKGAGILLYNNHAEIAGAAVSFANVSISFLSVISYHPTLYPQSPNVWHIRPLLFFFQIQIFLIAVRVVGTSSIYAWGGSFLWGLISKIDIFEFILWARQNRI